MTRHRVVLADDERPARAKLARLLAGDDRFDLVGEAADGIEALRQIEALGPDVVILDVQMPGLDGFEVLEALGPERQLAVILSTAHDRHALRAFDAHAVDYLLKPYDGERLGRALDKARAQLVAANVQQATAFDGPLAPVGRQGARERLVVRTVGGSWTTVQTGGLTRVSAANKHVRLFTAQKQHVVRQSLRVIEARLDPVRFVRVHRSEIVNVEAVARLDPWTHGDGILVLRDESTVILTRTYRRAFLERFHG